MYLHTLHVHYKAIIELWKKYICRIENEEEKDIEEACDVDEEVVAAFVEVPNADGEKAVSEDGEEEDEVDTEGASDSSDVVDAGKLCKKWESYPIGHKLER